MTRSSNRSRRPSLVRGLYMGLIALVLAWGVAFPSQAAVGGLTAALAIPVLGFIILTGVVFDIIGVAAAAADAAPLNAMATRRLRGAAQALYLVRHADAVSAFCSDVIGDIAGTVAGGAALAVALRLLGPGTAAGGALNALSLAAVASLTVGGKAAGKRLALDHSTEVMMTVGRIIGAVEGVTRVRLLPVERNGRPRRQVRRDG